MEQSVPGSTTKENHEDSADEQHVDRKSNRKKRNIERFALPSPAKPKQTTPDEATGSGVALSENAHAVKALDKLKSDDESLKRLHMILYGSVGTQSMRKREVRKWNGTDDTTRRESITRMLDLTKSSATLKDICSILGLRKGSTVDARRSAIAEYLFKPTASKKVKKPREKKPAKKPRVETDESFNDFLNRRAPQVESETGLTPAQVTTLLAREWKHMQAKPGNTKSDSSSFDSSSSSDSSSSDSD